MYAATMKNIKKDLLNTTPREILIRRSHVTSEWFIWFPMFELQATSISRACVLVGRCYSSM